MVNNSNFISLFSLHCATWILGATRRSYGSWPRRRQQVAFGAKSGGETQVQIELIIQFPSRISATQDRGVFKRKTDAAIGRAFAAELKRKECASTDSNRSSENLLHR